MSDSIRRYLDDELGFGELTPEERERARAWEALFRDLESRWEPTAPAALEERVMAEVADRPSPGRALGVDGEGADERSAGPGWRSALRWLFEPRTVVIRPALVVGGAAALLLLVFLPARQAPVPPPVAAGSDVYVEFVLEAPDAASVAVAGDFTGWSPEIALEDPDGDGVWSGRARLGPGVHEYMFVVDGSRWVTDPYAPRYADDGFGNRNAVLAIAGSAGDR